MGPWSNRGQMAALVCQDVIIIMIGKARGQPSLFDPQGVVRWLIEHGVSRGKTDGQLTSVLLYLTTKERMEEQDAENGCLIKSQSLAHSQTRNNFHICNPLTKEGVGALGRRTLPHHDKYVPWQYSLYAWFKWINLAVGAILKLRPWPLE